MSSSTDSFFVKSRRAQNEDDYESWEPTHCAATLNGFDNTGSVRATTLIIFYGNRVEDIRIQKAVINTLQARMGTGGNNTPMVLLEEDEVNSDIVGSLQARDYKGVGNQYVSENKLVVESPKTNVRRLTPLECERLQGFPDGWTEGQSDSARYKQMGNAVAVPVVDWIIGRLVSEHMGV